MASNAGLDQAVYDTITACTISRCAKDYAITVNHVIPQFYSNTDQSAQMTTLSILSFNLLSYNVLK